MQLPTYFSSVGVAGCTFAAKLLATATVAEQRASYRHLHRLDLTSEFGNGMLEAFSQASLRLGAPSRQMLGREKR